MYMPNVRDHTGMTGGSLGSYSGPTRKKQVITSESGIDTMAGMMPNAMMYIVEKR